MIDDSLEVGRDLHKPSVCENCGADVVYQGVGEYKCTKCRTLFYDDYGKVRNYIETHRGATQTEVSRATGVSKAAIRYLLRDDRIEIAPGSSVLLACELCKAPIRSGRFCPACESLRASQAKSSMGSGSSKEGMRGYSHNTIETSGAKRFTR